ncbi:XRE family transcriptional regulator [Pseudomonas aeruginosa]|nr:XRE family transcriptional regulator [Pseudomonas aeruginosa]
MTYDDFLRELDKAGLSVKRFADLVGMQPNSVSNNKKRGEVPIHLAVIVSLLAEMSARQIDYEPVMARVQPIKKRARGVAIGRRSSGDKPTMQGLTND